MSWPRKNDSMRLYQENVDKSFILVLTGNGVHGGTYDAIGNALYSGSSPSLASTGVGPIYLLNRCRRVEWSDLPQEWKRAFQYWLNCEPATKPESVRGFWRVGNQPASK